MKTHLRFWAYLKHDSVRADDFSKVMYFSGTLCVSFTIYVSIYMIWVVDRIEVERTCQNYDIMRTFSNLFKILPHSTSLRSNHIFFWAFQGYVLHLICARRWRLILWVRTPCSLVAEFLHFGWTQCLHYFYPEDASNKILRHFGRPDQRRNVSCLRNCKVIILSKNYRLPLPVRLFSICNPLIWPPTRAAEWTEEVIDTCQIK